MIRTLLPCTALAFTLSAAPLSAAGEWTTDFEAAKPAAAESDRDILLFFTGSDWCVFCKHLKENVLGTERFLKVAGGDFVLVEVDFPEDPSALPATTRQRNQALLEQYAVSGFPTLILADLRGVPYAQTGYEPGGVEPFLARLAALKLNRSTRDEALREAAEATGLERAQILARAIAPLEFDLQKRFHAEILDEIQTLDPHDTLGFAERARRHQLRADFASALEGFAGDLATLMEEEKFDEALAAIDTWIADGGFEGELKQQAMFLQLNVLGEQDRHQEALKTLDAIVAIDPSTEIGEGLRTQLRPVIEAAAREAAAPETETTE